MITFGKLNGQRNLLLRVLDADKRFKCTYDRLHITS